MRVPLGEPLRWTDEEWERLATLTVADLEAAAEQWRQDPPLEFGYLLDAAKCVNAGTINETGHRNR